MKRATAFFSVFLWLCSSVASAGDKEDLKRMQGKWRVVERILDGKKRDTGATWTISENEIDLGPGFAKRAVFKLDATTKPKRIDWDIAAIHSKGIYEIEGDRLRICHGGDERPSAFESKPGSKHVLTVLKRVKDEK